MSLLIGDKAPDFVLFNQKKEKVQLSSFSGKNVLLMFFPFANTSVCTNEMCTLQEDLNKFTTLNAEVLGISIDSPFALDLWGEKLGIKFNLLSDFNKEVIKKYDCYHDVFGAGKFDFQLVAKRSAFVIDKSGSIRYAEVLDNPGTEPNYSAIKNCLESLN